MTKWILIIYSLQTGMVAIPDYKDIAECSAAGDYWTKGGGTALRTPYWACLPMPKEQTNPQSTRGIYPNEQHPGVCVDKDGNLYSCEGRR